MQLVTLNHRLSSTNDNGPEHFLLKFVLSTEELWMRAMLQMAKYFKNKKIFSLKWHQPKKQKHSSPAETQYKQHEFREMTICLKDIVLTWASNDNLLMGPKHSAKLGQSDVSISIQKGALIKYLRQIKATATLFLLQNSTLEIKF